MQCLQVSIIAFVVTKLELEYLLLPLKLSFREFKPIVDSYCFIVKCQFIPKLLSDLQLLASEQSTAMLANQQRFLKQLMLAFELQFASSFKSFTITKSIDHQ